ncbi:acyltransferase family protein [Enterobacter kobei]|uniref:acyltransferase family protein n=1 Tax=Enterobacter kobei TaxID=208224 RepID=UPI000DCE0E79|nr:acyltransferase [Enterobacter kobei]ELE9752048.1 acyltransferase [Enterobacter kobei]RAY27713.1 acyltransferase [Enterobacter kobei]RAY45860.1 acyltransferase [Enterobacter kobei]
MSVYYSLCLIAACLTTALVLFSLPVFRFIDEDTTTARSNSLDGMRFFLASFVIFHHLDCAHTYITTGKWTPTSEWLIYMGKYGVALFFMTTAFLFWGKVRSVQTVDWVELYKKRFFRIVPLALFCSLIALIMLFSLTESKELTIDTVSNVLAWFDGGLWNSRPPVTSFDKSWMALAGVTWTLRWEWIFYFALPLFFMFNRWSIELAIVLFAFSVYFLPDITRDAYLWSYFFAGMLCRELKDRISLTKVQANTLLVVTIALAFLAQPDIFRSPEKFFLAIIFFTIVSGADLFGFLTTTAAKRLGAISYSLYLTQGLVLFPMSLYFRNEQSFSLDMKGMAILFCAYIMICLISAFTFHFIERKFMHGVKLKYRNHLSNPSTK